MTFRNPAIGLLLLVTLSGCGSQSLEKFYVESEYEWCQGRSADWMLRNFYYDDLTTRRFVSQIAQRFANLSRGAEAHCAAFDKAKEANEAHAEEVVVGQYKMYGLTVNGQWRAIANNWVVETDDGYRIRIQHTPQ